MSYFELNIEKVDNGFITSFAEEGKFTCSVFEEDASEHGEIECFARLLRSITDHYAMTGSKHDARRINISTGGEDGADI